MPPRRPQKSTQPEIVSDEESVSSLRYDATRKNNPPSGLAAQGRIAESPTSKYEYNPHLPPTLRFDATGKSDQLPLLLETARQRALTADEAEQLADALRRHEPWLEWSGKREKPWFEVDPVALHIHERISTQALLKALKRQDIQRSLFADPEQDYYEAVQFYKHDVDWSNRLILGDSLQVMASLARREDLAGKVQMIYFDPPYGIRFASNFQPQLGQRDVKDREQDLTREPEMVRAYRDTWTLGIHSYLAYLRDRLMLARDMLTDSGSIFVQISDENLHRVRMLLDEVFGVENQCSIITVIKTAGQSTSLIASISDYLLWYAKDINQVKFNQTYRPKVEKPSDAGHYSWVNFEDGLRRSLRAIEREDTKFVPADAKLYAPTSLISQGANKSGDNEFIFNGTTYNCGFGQHWKTNNEGRTRLAKAERIHTAEASVRFVRYLDDFAAIPHNNVWDDTATGNFTDDKIYVVQTGTKIIERCMLMTTDPGDLVLDPTCGSGTTAYVAEQWGRRWITMDTSRVAVALARQRLMTAKFPFYKLRPLNTDDLDRNPQGVWLRDPRGEVAGKATFQCKTVPHITLKSIARNASLDPIFARHEAILGEKLATLNAALQTITPELRTRLAAKLAAKEKREGKKSISDADRRRWLLPVPKPLPTPPLQREGTVPPLDRGRLGGGHWQPWQVPFDTDPDWTDELQSALTDYRSAWRAKMDEVNDCIAQNAAMEELVDKPEEVKNVVRVSGPFTVEGVMALEEGPDSPIGGTPDEELESFAGDESIKHDPTTVNAEAHLDKMLRLLRAAGVDFKGNQNVRFTRIEPISGAGFIHFEGEWVNSEGELRQVGISVGPEVGNVSDYQVQDCIFNANRRGYNDLLFTGFGFDANAQATIEDDANPRIRLHMALIRPDVAMSDLLKTQPGSQIFTIFSAPRVATPKKQKDDQQKDDQWTVEVEGMDIYDPVSNQLFPSNKDQIAAWFLDSDYDGRTFCVCQAFFPNKANWEKLAKALGNSGVIDDGAFDALSGLRSLPFSRPKHLRANERWQVAVKVIDPRGNEGLRVLNMELVMGGEARYS